jgi:hypothetical protein
MIGYFLLIALVILFVVLTVIGDKHEHDVMAVLCCVAAIIFGSLLGTSSMYLVIRNSDARDFKMDRDYQQELVYNISDNMSFYAIEKTISTAKEMNERIEENKSGAYSKMWGFMHNKGIAEVELIDIPEIEYKIVKKE